MRSRGEILSVLSLVFLIPAIMVGLSEPSSAADMFKDCDACPQMVKVPGGTFMMGSPEGEAKRQDYEGPRHRVKVGRFAIGRYEVTFAEWDACHAAGGCKYRPKDSGWGRGRRPVSYVSWKDAKQYVAWLSAKTGKRYRLPSEAEWEYAARAGTRTRYWWGDAVGENNANCKGCGSRWGKTKTAPVGSFKPNKFGLHDMLGNVWEWVEDCWHRTFKGAPSTGKPWVADGKCDRRVLRGGSWGYYAKYARSASRAFRPTYNRVSLHGFRVARTLP